MPYEYKTCCKNTAPVVKIHWRTDEENDSSKKKVFSETLLMLSYVN